MAAGGKHNQPGYEDPPAVARKAMYDRAAELAVLGACLLGKLDIVAQYREAMPGNPFYVVKHAEVWRHICSLADDGIPTDPVSVAERWRTKGARFVDPEDRVWLVELYSNAPLVHSLHHAQTVAKWAAARSVVEAGMRMQQLGEAADLDRVEQMLEQAKADLAAVVIDRPTRQPWHEHLVDGAAFALDVPASVPLLWGSDDGRVLWAEGESLMLVGPPGVGKSTVAGQVVAARLGLGGGEVLRLPVRSGGRVLWLACDRPAQIARSLRRTIGREDWRDAIRDRLVVWKGPPPADFGQRPELLLAMAKDADADTVVIDSMKDVCTGLTEDAPAAGYNRARQLALANGIQLLELHHTTKYGPNGAAPTELANVYGNQQLTGGAGSVVLLWGKAGDVQVTLSHLKPVQDVVGPYLVSHDHMAGTSTVEREPDLVLLAAHAPAGITADEAARAIKQTTKPRPADIEHARRQLERLVARGLLIKAGRRNMADPNSPATYLAAAQEEDDR
ncbi:AAA family ATPase [Micromonospora sp. 4G55]|uniref:AAA family ATPase n=1 Tax=Micromonospora sp. 4G55 TaxID=2806102 RepID=UPI001A5F6375|nr:AAA family ATPase [Micromonospora sp. 4G55]MBM0256357.1 AAA family ATPase [Micromonospora sp. 4G55]